MEANDSGHMKLIAEHYGMEMNGEGYVYKGVVFEPLNSKNETEFECIVYDLGVLNDKSKVGFENCILRVLCTGDKPHELPFLQKAITLLINTKYHINFMRYCIESSKLKDCKAFDYDNDLTEGIDNQRYKNLLYELVTE